MSQATPNALRRRLGAWGFDGQEFPPPDEMLHWLQQRLGESKALVGFDAAAQPLKAPRDLPDLGPALLSSDGFDRLRHSRGQNLSDLLRLRSGTVPAVPDAVARPQDEKQLETLLQNAAKAGLRIIPWGGGTSVTGGVTVVDDPRPVVTVDLEAFSGLEDLDEKSGLARLGAGTRGPEIERALADRGFTLGHFPQSFELSTLGGWIVTHSSGQESLGYGRIADRVAGLDLVAPAGRLHMPALPASATGPDLRQWAIGSEGRFGLVTHATVRVAPRPQTMRVEAAMCREWQQGLELARDLMRQKVPLCLLRLSDPPETEVAITVGLAKGRFADLKQRYLKWRGVDQGCLLLLGAHGEPWQVDRAFEQARAVSGRQGAVWLGAGPGRHWQRDRFRHPYLRDGLLDHGYGTDTFETAAPWSRLPEVYERVRSALEDVPLLCHLSHPYADGASLYFTFFFRCSQDPDQALEQWASWKRKAQDALADSGAATSHHHGVGFWHAPWAPREWGDGGTRMLKAVARELDPQGIMNPHVLLDPSDRLEI